jgi:hypothetical protein
MLDYLYGVLFFRAGFYFSAVYIGFGSGTLSLFTDASLELV